jgi:hypothetical protein
LKIQKTCFLKNTDFPLFGEKHVFHQKPEKPRFYPFIDKTILLQLMTIALLRLYNTKDTRQKKVSRGAHKPFQNFELEMELNISIKFPVTIDDYRATAFVIKTLEKRQQTGQVFT